MLARMNNHKVLIYLMILVILIIYPSNALAEPPPLPSSFYGTVKVDGKNVPTGTSITAWIRGVRYGAPATVTLYKNDTVFSLSIPGDELSTEQVEGGVGGDVVQFRIGNQPIDQQGSWKSGTNIQLNLSYNTVRDRNYVYLPLMIR